MLILLQAVFSAVLLRAAIHGRKDWTHKYFGSHVDINSSPWVCHNVYLTVHDSPGLTVHAQIDICLSSPNVCLPLL